VVDEILIAQRDAADALHEHGLDTVLHQLRHAAVDETAGQAPHQTDRPIGSTQQQRSGIRGDLSTVERSHHLPSFDRFISKQIAVTLCRHRGSPLDWPKRLTQKELSDFRWLWLVVVAHDDGATRCHGLKPLADNIGATSCAMQAT
jgi:hypothetical protein